MKSVSTIINYYYSFPVIPFFRASQPRGAAFSLGHRPTIVHNYMVVSEIEKYLLETADVRKPISLGTKAMVEPKALSRTPL